MTDVPHPSKAIDIILAEEQRNESITNVINPPVSGQPPLPSTGAGGFEVIRFQVTAAVNTFQLAAQLPVDTAIWRVKNTDPSTLVYVGIDDPNPSIISTGRTPVIELEPKQVDVPPIVPLIIGRPVTIYLARAATTSSPVVEIVYTNSKDPRVLASLALGIPPTSATSAIALSGLNVTVSGQTVRISGETVSIAGGVNVSGSHVILYNANRGLVFSGLANWGSGNTSGNPVTLVFAPPSVYGQDDVVVAGLLHAALSSDITVVVEKALLFGSTVSHLELTRFTQNRGTSGVAQPIRGIFAGGTSGRLVVMHNQSLVENVTGQINVWQV